MFKNWQERAVELGLPWAVQRLEEVPDENEGGRGPTYRWVNVVDIKQLQGSVLLVVHSHLAGYDPAEGFLPNRDTNFRVELPDKPLKGNTPWHVTYSLESYVAHIQKVCTAIEGLPLEELAFPAAALEKRAGWPSGYVTRAAWAVAALHDVGKLTTGWQGWARTWQKGVGNPLDEGEAAAHTDYDSYILAHRQLERELSGKRPPHAVEGAVAAAPLLIAILGECEPLIRAAFTAIARHHGPFTSTYRPFYLDQVAQAQVAAACARLPPAIAAKVDPAALIDSPTVQDIRRFIVEPEETEAFIAYTLLSRALRRADQAGTRSGIQREFSDR
jgi:CRISPR-associated endonuclease/helicase Cas3